MTELNFYPGTGNIKMSCEQQLVSEKEMDKSEKCIYMSLSQWNKTLDILLIKEDMLFPLGKPLPFVSNENAFKR